MTRVQLAQFFHLERSYEAIDIVGVSSLDDPRAHTLAFVARQDDTSTKTVTDNLATTFLVPLDWEGEQANVLPVPRPRLAYAQALRDLMQHDLGQPEISDKADVHPGARLGERVSVGPFAVIEDGVVIGDGCRIGSHTTLSRGVIVGSNVVIGTHTAIGHAGFGFEVDDEGRPIRIAHLGGVEVGDFVEIGSHVSIAQGTINPTRIDAHVKIDDCVFLAHNVAVGEAAFIIAGAEVSGSVTIGKRAWISPEATILQKMVIGDDALVGLGAVVVSDVPENTIVAGVPAKPRGLRFTRPE